MLSLIECRNERSEQKEIESCEMIDRTDYMSEKLYKSVKFDIWYMYRCKDIWLMIKFIINDKLKKSYVGLKQISKTDRKRFAFRDYIRNKTTRDLKVRCEIPSITIPI